MKKYVIVTDSCSDLSKELREKYDIEYIKMKIIIDGKEYPASLDWEDFSKKEFYGLVKEGKRMTTAQITAIEYKKVFEAYIKNGFDVLSISCSSALSSSYNGSLVAKKELDELYPDSKIICIDARNACLGLGLICITASTLREEGLTIEETAKYIEDHKLEVNQFCTVEDLTYLRRSGRVSATSAFMGGLFQVKPIIISDIKGQNLAIEKVKGRKASFERILNLFCESLIENPYQKIIIAHADCIEDAMLLKENLAKRIDLSKYEVIIDYIGPIVGSTVGPGTVALYGFCKAVEI